LQKRYRYLKNKGKKANLVGPVITIQRCWRGLSAALRVLRQDDAAFKIQQNYKAWQWNRRSRKLLNSAFLIQRIWKGAIYRRWIKECHGAATLIQQYARGLQVRATLDKTGRQHMRDFKGEMVDLLRQRRSTPEDEERFQKSMADLAFRIREKMNRIRARNIDTKRNMASAMRSRRRRGNDKETKLRMKGVVQPIRQTVFEPMCIALARLEPDQDPRLGENSRVLVQILGLKKNLDRTLPKEVVHKAHPAAKRGRAALRARRFAKKPKEVKQLAVVKGPVDTPLFNAWAMKQFGGA